MKELLSAYERMLKLRVASEELVTHYLDNKVFSMVHFYAGQEAVAVGVCDALANPHDLAMGTHRSHGYYLAKGGNFRRLAAELFGRAAGAARGKGGSMHMVDRSVGFAGTTPLLGSGVPLAAGRAFAKKYLGEDGIVAAFYGDGASEEGVVYETYNLAALYDVPLLLVLENNSWSINSPLTNRRAHNYDIEKVVEGLGMRYARADGNDYESVYAAASNLVEEIRRGGGPAVLECTVYRHMAHSTPLMEERFRINDTLEERLAKDPLAKMKSVLLSQGIAQENLTEKESALREEIRADIAWALTQPYPPQEELFTDVYAD
jgi:pyruvate dehydrogenase E1 component alpha subunit